MSSLFVHLPLEPIGSATELAFALSPDGRTPGPHTSAAVALLPQPAGVAAEVVAVVPVDALSWHLVDLPKGVAGGSPRVRAVLAGLLEDRLLDEPESLHFALQPAARAGERAWVAVCNKAWLHAALQALEAAGRRATRIVPEFAPGPVPSVHVLGGTPDARIVATGVAGVVAIPLSSGAPLALGTVFGVDGATGPAFEAIPCHAEPAAAALAERLLARPVSLQQAPQRWLDAAQSDWDLAQFDLTSTGSGRLGKRVGNQLLDWLRAPRWAVARWGLGLLLLANLVGLNAAAWKERNALAAKQGAVRAVLLETFPGVKVVVDAPLQMQREAAALRQGSGALSNGDLEAMLAALGTAIGGTKTVSGIEFKRDETRITGLPLSPEELARAQASLRGNGLMVRRDAKVLTLSTGAAP